MSSPYTAPASTFLTDATALGDLRWRGVVYFAFIPTLFMLFMQGSVIYSEFRSGPMYWHLKMIEPLLFCAPVCLLMAATGHAVAIRCLNGTIGRALWLGCVVGAVWTLVAVIAGNAIAQLNGAMPLALHRLVGMLIVIGVVFVPLGMVLCIFTRWRGMRLGLADRQLDPQRICLLRL